VFVPYAKNVPVWSRPYHECETNKTQRTMELIDDRGNYLLHLLRYHVLKIMFMLLV
jgi:hypothetical protein